MTAGGRPAPPRPPPPAPPASPVPSPAPARPGARPPRPVAPRGRRTAARSLVGPLPADRRRRTRPASSSRPPPGAGSSSRRSPPTGTGTREEVTIPSLGESVSRIADAIVPPAGRRGVRARPPPRRLPRPRGLPRPPRRAPLGLLGRRGRSAPAARGGGSSPPPSSRGSRGLAPALPIADLAFYSEDFLALLDPRSRVRRARTSSAPRLPGCAFDATFGYPCTADERRREEWLFRRTPAPSPR